MNIRKRILMCGFVISLLSAGFANGTRCEAAKTVKKKAVVIDAGHQGKGIADGVNDYLEK